MMTSPSPLDTHSELVTNRTKFDARMLICFGPVETYSHTHTDTPSVTSELSISVQPAVPTSPIGRWCEQKRKVYVFSAHKIFMS